MAKQVSGVYRNGKIELLEKPDDAIEEAAVIVTFLDASSVDLASRGIDPKQAAELRDRLTPFIDEWDSPEMRAYDNYDAAKRKP